MLGKLITIMMLMIAISSAESLNVSNYNVIFTMIQPHEVTMPQSEIYRNGTGVRENNEIFINSSNGFVVMVIGSSNFTDQKSFAEVMNSGSKLTSLMKFPDTPVNSIKVDNKTGWYTINYLNQLGTPVYIIEYYIRAPPGTTYDSAPSGSDTTVFNIIMSTMPSMILLISYAHCTSSP